MADTTRERLTALPDFTPALEGFRAEEFLRLTESLLAIPIEQDQVRLDASSFRLEAPEFSAEGLLPPLPPRWYPRPAPDVAEATRASMAPPPRPVFFAGRQAELDRVLRPLLSGHPIILQGEPGVGKTTFLAAVAMHERTRQRFRRIWWIDDPARLDQTLALALNLPHVLAERDPVFRRELLAAQFNDHTLLVVDNALSGEIDLGGLYRLTPHVLVAFETASELLDPDEPPPDDPDGVVTLRALDETAAVDALAHFAGIDDTRRIRGDLLRVARALGGFPYTIRLAGLLMQQDGLSLDELESLLEIDDALAAQAQAEENGAEPVPPHLVALNAVLDISLGALPGDYRALVEAFAAFPMDGAPFDGLHAAARIGSPLATRRGLTALAQYGFARPDFHDPTRTVMHPTVYARAAATDPHSGAPGKRMRAWALQYAKDHAGDPLALYGAESALRYALAISENLPEKSAPLDKALRSYLQEYTPGVAGTAHAPVMGGARGEATALTVEGLRQTDEGAYEVAEQTLQRALELRREHDSAHAVAETMVALGRLYDAMGRYAQAEKLLVEAAEVVFNLGAEESVSVLRRCLARVYRHMGRLNDALAVLDEAAEAHLERAMILRAQGHYADAMHEIDCSPDASPYLRAELSLLAGHYAEALAAIAEEDDPATGHLRAQIYHLEGSSDHAIRGYEMALETCAPDDPSRARSLRGLGAALASGEQYTAACGVLEEALALHRQGSQPDRLGLGRTLRLLAAVYFVAGDTQHAADTARAALEQLEGTKAVEDIADTCRTLGRALWRLEDYAGAQDAFEREVNAAQSITVRSEDRIGTALHHLADTYRMAGSIDRAVANYRRALTHKNAAQDPTGYFVTQLALHRGLVEQGRLQVAMDVAQEILDQLEKQPEPDLQQVGFAQVIRARTQQAMDRPIRAGQSLQEWTQILASRADEALLDPRQGLRVLILGLAARSLLADSRPSLALAAAQEAVQVAESRFPDSPAAWAARRDLGEAYMALDQVEESVLALEPLLDEAVRKTDAATYAAAQMVTGQGYRRLDERDEALAHLRLALDAEPDAHRRGLIQDAIGDVLLALGRPGEAIESLHAAADLLDREAHPDVTARVLTTLAHTLGGQNRYAEAIDVYEDALVVLRSVENVNPTHTADVLCSLGQTHEAQGQLSEAARAYRRALNILEKVESPRQMRDTLHLLARVTGAMGDQSAVQLYEQTFELTQQIGSERELGAVLRELGDVHREAERIGPSVQCYQSALEHQPAEQFPDERVATLRNLGRAYARMQRYDEARAMWAEALELSRDLPDHSPLQIALTYYSIAEAHRVQEHYPEAEKAYREALKLHVQGKIETAATWRALGQVLHAEERYDDAVDALRNAFEAEKAQPQQANARLVQTLQLLAKAHEARGDLAQAIARHHEVLVYMDRRLQPVAYAETLRALGKLYRESQKVDQALKALDEALEIENGHAPRSDERISATLQSIADTYRAAGELERAAEYYQRVTLYENMARRASEDLRDTLDELERRRATLQAAEQSLALLDLSDNAELKDLAFIYALIARSHAGLSQPRESADAIDTLIDILLAHRDDVRPDAGPPDNRALAWLIAARDAQEADRVEQAESACATALELVHNANLRWVIQQVAHSVG
ncbi:tetratricopeptide repeat protein [Aggregatilinea lenta]|uniref:tetratricopeptide repeat protein n=1 Tax=Aggregatilinea lenta TaxID=913108 RepID=UPI000E5AAA7F|nr:tetratricopeptide repeat protein [Aggregatilinea lenta]